MEKNKLKRLQTKKETKGIEKDREEVEEKSWKKKEIIIKCEMIEGKRNKE